MAFKPRLISALRQGVDFLGRHPWARRIFKFVGYFSVRLIYPLEYLLLSELLDCRSVLDLGCGPHSTVPILPSSIRTVGVEAFEPYYQTAVQSKRHSEYLKANITEVDFEPASFDAVVLSDVLEHLPKKDGEVLIEKMFRWARKKVILFTPNGFMPQEDVDENPLMQHLSGWTAQELRAKGFRLRGVRGLRSLRLKTAKPYETGFHWANAVIDFTQVFTYHKPEWAFQLFCVRKKS